jgi:hypothetical protein
MFDSIKQIVEADSQRTVNNIVPVCVSGRWNSLGALQTTDFDIVDGCVLLSSNKILTATYDLMVTADMNGYVTDGTEQQFNIAQIFIDPAPFLQYLNGAYTGGTWNLSLNGSLVVTLTSTLYDCEDLPNLFVRKYLPNIYKGEYREIISDNSAATTTLEIYDYNEGDLQFFYTGPFHGVDLQSIVKNACLSALGVQPSDVVVDVYRPNPYWSGTYIDVFVTNLDGVIAPVGSSGEPSLNGLVFMGEYDGDPGRYYMNWTEQEQFNEWQVPPVCELEQFPEHKGGTKAVYFGQIVFTSDYNNVFQYVVNYQYSKDVVLHKATRQDYFAVSVLDDVLFSNICVGNATRFQFIGYKIHFDL